MTSYLNIYWLWKPYIIKKTMEMMDDDDILLYLAFVSQIHNNPVGII